ncbi:MAG: glycosyltransferase family 2 protein [Vampirovibrionales bacterium]
MISQTYPISKGDKSLTDDAYGVIMRPDCHPKVSIVVPVYNEEENVGPLFAELVAVCDAMGDVYELVFVDDGSSDGTVSRLKQLVGQHSSPLHQMRVVELSRNYGQTAAMAAGFELARGDVLVTLDGDLQNDPQDIPLLIRHLHDNRLDMVVGWRQNRQDAALTRKLPSWIANRLIGAMTGVRFKDYGCSLKAYRRDMAQDLPMYGELHRFIPVLVTMEGGRIGQVPVHHRARRFGQSKYGLSRTFKVILDLGMLLFMKKFFTRPLHLFGKVGGATLLVGMGVLFWMLVEKLVFGQSIGSRPMLMLGILLFFSGIQLISTGLIADLKILTYFESQKKRPYRVRSIVGT